MKRRLVGLLLSLFIILGLLVGFLAYSARPLMLINGQILTMDTNDSVVTSLGVRSGKIQALGTPQQVRAALLDQMGPWSWFYRFLGVQENDLKGQTVVPGFIDAHSHFPSSGLLSQGVDLSRRGAGGVSDMASLLKAISAQAQEQSANRWIISFSYDDSALAEQRHPTRQELDAVAPDHAVYLRHRSGHMGVANSRALRELGYEPATTMPETSTVAEGSDVGLDDRQQMSGLLQDRATPAMQRLLEEIAWWRKPAILLDARDEYLRAGVTTVQNGYADRATVQLLRWAKVLGIVPQRIVVWPAHDKLTEREGKLFLTGSDEGRLTPVESLDQETCAMATIRRKNNGYRCHQTDC